jgi:hypothetical protein
MIQAGRSPVRVPDEVDFFNLPNPSSRTMALGFDSASNRNEYQEYKVCPKSHEIYFFPALLLVGARWNRLG